MNIKTVYFEITNRCNLNCLTCYNRSGLNRETNEISVAQLETAMKNFEKYGANRFLFSGGEPLLHSDFNSLLKLIDRYPNFSFGFVTNGTIHNEKWVDFLNSHDNITLQVSLDGANETQNALTRGNGNFEKAIAFAKKINNPRLNSRLKMVVSQYNLNGVEDFYRLAISLGFTPEFAFIYKSGNGSDDWNNKSLSPSQKLNILQTIHRLNLEHGVDAFLPKCSYGCSFNSEKAPLSICVKTDGSIQPCQTLYDNRFSIGNIFDFSENIIQSRVDALHRLANVRTSVDLGCEKCLLRDGCKRGCMAEAFNASGDPLVNDGEFMFRKIQFLHFHVKKPSEFI